MRYLEEEKLCTFVAKNQEPSFESFVNSYQNDLVVCVSLAPDVDAMMLSIQQHKSNLSNQRKRVSEEYIILNIVERVAENLNLWETKTKDSELTFYRRFAEFLDSKEINKSLFDSSNISVTYPKKIDLLMRLDESIIVELSSSEWKKSSVSESLILKQQTKNLKVNVCILSLLRSVYGNQFNTVLAMDWIGNIGYLYKITKVDKVFVANQIDKLMIPENIETFGMLKDTLNNLFRLKYFMTNMCSLLQKEMSSKTFYVL
ncbi:hypothetical protein EDC94DRAFT_697633 [Helicostylum pulchrum]|nr:hypothetical protein EDC94DRAFT_697633 [Helicostylum pulchrum]